MFYAEFETDKYIRETFFPSYDYFGIMVEVGAGPPDVYSMSKHFREHNWRCICIEPNPKFFYSHLSLGHEVYQYACSNEEKLSTFKIASCDGPENTNGISFSSLDIRYETGNLVKEIKEIEVEVIKLNRILESLRIKKIDFISVDTEGWEIDVMEGFDILRFQPEVVILENYLYDENYEKVMNQFNYYLHNKIEYNYIFTK
jgi:FkbM family methyltransferase